MLNPATHIQFTSFSQIINSGNVPLIIESLRAPLAFYDLARKAQNVIEEEGDRLRKKLNETRNGEPLTDNNPPKLDIQQRTQLENQFKEFMGRKQDEIMESVEYKKYDAVRDEYVYVCDLSCVCGVGRVPFNDIVQMQRIYEIETTIELDYNHDYQAIFNVDGKLPDGLEHETWEKCELTQLTMVGGETIFICEPFWQTMSIIQKVASQHAQMKMAAMNPAMRGGMPLSGSEQEIIAGLGNKNTPFGGIVQ